MTMFFLISSIILSSVRNILSKSISDLNFGTKQFFIIQSCIFACGSLILVFATSYNFDSTSLLTSIYAIIYSLLLLSAQYCYTVALKKGNVGICSVVYSLGFIFPTLSGRLFWNEKLTLLKILGILMVIPAIIVSGSSRNTQQKSGDNYITPLLIAMLSSGGLGVVQKIQQNSPYPDEKNCFLISAFAFASIISFLISLFAKGDMQIKLKKKLFSGAGVGVAFGLSNLLNTVLAGKLDSAVFFPVLNIGTILFSIIAGVVLFKEKISRKDLAVLILGITAILLITCT